MKPPSITIQGLERSGIREIFDLANRIPDAIHLEMGEPNFPTPAHVVEAAAKAARDGHTKYTPNAGVPELREALAQKVKTRNGLDAETEQMEVTPGAIAALYGTMMAEAVRRLCKAIDAWSSCGDYRSRRLPSAASAESSSDLESAT